MDRKPLGSTGLLVSEIGFGTWAIGGDSYGRTDDRVSDLAIRESLDLGCNFFETADVYGAGHSESLLGRSLRDAGRLNDVVIATKGGLYPSIGASGSEYPVAAADIVAFAEMSLRRLGRDFIDIYQLHNPPLHVLKEGAVFEALLSLRERGLVRFLGVSVQTLAEARAALRWDALSTIQMPYNISDLLNPEMSLEQIAPMLSRQKIGVIARDVLSSGFLSGKYDRDAVFPELDFRAGLRPIVISQRVAIAEGLRPLARQGHTLAQVAIRYVMDQPFVDCALVGIKTPEQARENFAAARLPRFESLAEDFGVA